MQPLCTFARRVRRVEWAWLVLLKSVAVVDGMLTVLMLSLTLIYVDFLF